MANIQFLSGISAPGGQQTGPGLTGDGSFTSPISYDIASLPLESPVPGNGSFVFWNPNISSHVRGVFADIQDPFDKGYFVDETALLAQYPNTIADPNDRAGRFVRVGTIDGDVFFVWDTATNERVNSGTAATAVVWGTISGLLDNQTDLNAALNSKEVLSNKVGDFAIINNTLYPTTQAVADYIQANTIQTLTDGHFLIGDNVNNPVARLISGDATVTNLGVLTVANGAINTVKLADNAVSTSKIQDNNVTFEKIQQIGANTLVGNDTSATDDAREIAVDPSSVLGRLGGDIENIAILDENNMISDSNSSLATQSSIKAYVDLMAVGALVPQGTWDADANAPSLASGVGTVGHLYIVNNPGNTILDGNGARVNGDILFFANGVRNRVGNTQLPEATQAESDAGVISGKVITPLTGNINNRTTENTLDLTNDQVEYRDTSGAIMRKTSIANLTGTKARTTLTVSGTTATIDLAVNNKFLLDLRTSTGNVTITISNPIADQSFLVDVIDHGTTPRTLTFPVGTLGLASEGNTYVADLPNTMYKMPFDYYSTDPIAGAHYQFSVIPDIGPRP